MQTLILPGYSSKNKSWVDEVASQLQVGGEIRPFYWMHWSDDVSKFDAQEKAGLITKHLRGNQANIIAKSLGTLVACKVFSLIPDQIGKMILCGIPTIDLDDHDREFIKTVCVNNKHKITIIQNINDPHGNFESIKGYGNIIPKEASDHNYPYYQEFNRILG